MEQCISGTSIALVARNKAFAEHLQTHLSDFARDDSLVCDFDNISDYLSRDCDGLIFAAVETTDDQRDLTHLMQKISLQQLRPTLVVVHKDFRTRLLQIPLLAAAPQSLHWPDDADKMTQLANRFTCCGQGFIRADELPLEEKLRREIVEHTPSLKTLADRLAVAAQHDVTVLLTGETGSGKTFCARVIHENSPRRNHRFLPVSCGALADNLVESEFFGHVRGAFTGADRDKTGKFAAVGEGTLLLDEVDTLSLKHQATLLRAIESGEFEPVGSVDTQICQARLIVASNIQLERAVDAGAFRPDLYFRLNVMAFHFPALCERIDDIAPLAQKMAVHFNRKFSKALFRINADAIAALESFPWPGNIRQLENVIQHAVLLSTGPELLTENLPEPVQNHYFNSDKKKGFYDASLRGEKRKSEKSAIRRALVAHEYNRSRAAKALGISRVALHKKLKEHDLTRIPLESKAKSI